MVEQAGTTWVKLPGAVRHCLQASPDGSVLLVTERAQAEGRDLLRLRVVDLANRSESELGQVADLEPRYLPDGAVLAAAREKAPVERPLVTRATGKPETIKRLIRIDPSTRAQTPMAPAWFDVDTALVLGEEVYFTAGLKAWKVGAKGGEPVQVAEEVAELHAALGSQLVVTSTSGRVAHAALLSVDGGQTELGEAATVTGGGEGIVLRRKSGSVQALARGAQQPVATPTPCASPRVVSSSKESYAACDDPGKQLSTLLEWREGGWQTVAEVEKLPVARASKLGAGRLAVLLEQKGVGDLNLDGVPESDLYLLETPAKTQVRPAPRDLPLRLMDKREELVAIANEAGLPEPRFRTSQGGAAIRIDAEQDGPATLQELRRVASAAQQRLAAAVTEPRLGVELHYGKSGRYARRTWDNVMGRMVSSVGYAGVNTVDVSEAEDFELETLEPKVEIRQGLGNKSYICSGQVKNRSSRSLSMLAECEPLGVAGWGWGPQGPPPGHQTPVEPSPLQPGESGKYFARGTGADAGAQQRFLVRQDGKDRVVEAFDEARHARAVACFELGSALPALRYEATGRFGLAGLGLFGVSRMSNPRNRCSELLVVGAPEGFSDMPLNKRAEQATRLAGLIAQTQGRHPKAALPAIKFVDEKGRAWALKAGRWAEF